MKTIFQSILCSMVIAALSTDAAYALLPFKKAFDQTYVVHSPNEAFKTDAKKASCAICHNKKGPKNVHNEYGVVLEGAIEGNAKKRLEAAKATGDEAEKAELAKILQELADGFKKAETTASKSGATYGELIKGGKLPAP